LAQNVQSLARIDLQAAARFGHDWVSKGGAGMEQGILLPLGLIAALGLAACGEPAALPKAESPASPAVSAPPATWPADLRVMGDGFPRAGDACRRLGESALTSNYLDDSAVLVGCPGSAADSPARGVLKIPGSRAVGAAEGVTFISIPMGDANAGLQASAPPKEGEAGA
jgi:hypothetical protein